MWARQVHGADVARVERPGPAGAVDGFVTTRPRLARAAVQAAVAAGARADRLHATLGPSIGPCCYEVDEPVIAAFHDAYGATADAWLTPGRPGHVMLDLWAADEAVLRDAGVPAERIDNPRLCTACHLDLFYSYRKGARGRLVTIAALP
ncbi:MAG: laccase domain-containing protein [Candidatus Rokubacteria bacterium]|nr:laccase domain-containing protein [Candidatus Rokubacteria bacterium]